MMLRGSIQRHGVTGTGLTRQSVRFLGTGRPVKKGTVSGPLQIPGHIERPPYFKDGIDPFSGQAVSRFDLKGTELEKMRDACKHARDTLDYAGELVKPGVTTDEIDRKVHEHVLARNIYPSPFGYRQFPKSLCSSVNEVMCHGIPDDRELVEGDIVNLDVSCYVKGYHGDTSKTFKVGKVNETANRIVDMTEKCLEECIKVCGPNVPLNLVGATVSKMCDEYGFQTSRTFCGHGIGKTFHMLPYVLHMTNNDPTIMVPGMVFTIEPIICEGSEEYVLWDDEWTIATKDFGLSAQFEHTIVITDHGAEILT